MLAWALPVHNVFNMLARSYSGLCGWSKTTGFKDCSQYPDDTWPEMKVFVMNGDNSEDARIQMYSSGPLQNYPYDNCNLNGGWGDQATKNDGCYSPAVKVCLSLS